VRRTLHITPELEAVVASFLAWADSRKLVVCASDLRTQVLMPPHYPEPLPTGWQGVYTFKLDTAWLKVGKAGPRSNARWVSQHYYPTSSMSNLARSLLRYAACSEGTDPRLPAGVKASLRAIDPVEIGDWIRCHTARYNILIPASLGRDLLAELERIAIRVLRAVFEGSYEFT